jgi:hypothetical protein
MGEYEGVFVSLETSDYSQARLTINDKYGYELDWYVSTDKLVKKIKKARPGDKVLVEVEFNDYRVVGFTISDLDPRALLARIEALESKLGE